MDTDPKLAADRLAEIVRINNEQARTLEALRCLADEYRRVCCMFCKAPETSESYRTARRVIAGDA